MNTEELTSTTQNEIFWVPQLRISGEDHWPVARANRGYDTRISRAESIWVPRDVQEPGSGRKAREQEVEGVRQGRHLWRVTIAMHGRAQRGHVVHPYQQLAVAEDIAEGHDCSDNREELALVNLLLFPSAEAVHPRKDVVRHLRHTCGWCW